MTTKKKLPRGIAEHRGKYRVRIVHKGESVSLGVYTTLTHAKAALAIARADIAQGTFTTPRERKAAERAAAEAAEREAARNRYTVDDLYRDFEEYEHSRGLTVSTIYSRESKYRVHARPVLGSMPVVEVTPKIIMDWYDRLHEEKGDGVSHDVFSMVRTMFNYATGKARGLPYDFERVIERSPFEGLEMKRRAPVKDPNRVRIATPEQVAGIAAEMKPHVRFAVYIAAWAGLRMGEVLELRRSDFYTTQGRNGTQYFISIKRQVQHRGGGAQEQSPKSQAGTRNVPLPSPLVDMYEQHLRNWAGYGDDGLIFPREKRGRRHMHPNTMRFHFERGRDAWNEMQRERGGVTLETLTFHDLRHTFLTMAGRAHATGPDLQRLGGHSDIQTVQIYQHTTEDRLADVSEEMARQLVLPPADDGGNVIPINAKERTA